MGNPLLVRGIQGIQDLSGAFYDSLQRQRALQRRALDVFHHQVIRADVVYLADVGMIQGGDGLRFAREAFAELRGRDFDSDIPIQTRVPRSVYLSHSTLANES